MEDTKIVQLLKMELLRVPVQSKSDMFAELVAKIISIYATTIFVVEGHPFSRASDSVARSGWWEL